MKNKKTDERQLIYREIAKELQEVFPEGTVQKNNKYVHIPVQAYLKRLEEKAGSYWSWELQGEPIFYERESMVMVKGSLTIVDARRTGIGFSQYNTFEDTGKIQQLKAVINAAESDAIRNACDKYLMGWKDLAPYREWANNPAVGLNNRQYEHEKLGEQQYCVRCNKVLSMTEVTLLKEKGIRQLYCNVHIPEHLLR